MGLPRKLKNMMVFHNGVAYVGEATSVTLPKLARKLEEYRAGGMDGPVGIDMGQDGLLELEHAYGGFMREIIRGFGVTEADGEMLRFVGAYQRDDSGEVDRVEIVARGRHQEIDPGEAKPGEDTEFKVKTVLAYYKLEVNGVEEVEIDVLNMVFRVGGVDRLAAQRAALGI
ncbi:MAG TPA: phage major tail tube protein [Allosphingosinicella sp.]|uniref:phage major tail tube protein n=1 Tax=Allosphingosinicella sp. TaxID=2823234 RepID=UPI002ED7CD5E